MPTAPSQLRSNVDQVITNKTLPYSISNTDVGNLLKDMLNLIESKQTEVITFVNQSIITLDWNDDRKIAFGAGSKICAEILGSDGKYRQIPVEIVPDNITNTSTYTIDLGGISTGRLIIG